MVVLAVYKFNRRDRLFPNFSLTCDWCFPDESIKIETFSGQYVILDYTEIHIQTETLSK